MNICQRLDAWLHARPPLTADDLRDREAAGIRRELKQLRRAVRSLDVERPMPADDYSFDALDKPVDRAPKVGWTGNAT